MPRELLIVLLSSSSISFSTSHLGTTGSRTRRPPRRARRRWPAAPKIRAMQLIKNFEKDARGPYAGVYGSIDINGALNTAITIRTMIVQPSNDGEYIVSVQAGAGIVADSSPANGFDEYFGISASLDMVPYTPSKINRCSPNFKKAIVI